MEPIDPRPDGTLEVPGRLVLFGYEAQPVRVRLRPRSRRWRALGALRTGGLFLVAAPALGVIPPHAPWVLGALGAGVFLARRRLQHRFTVEGLEGSCPKCGGPVRVRTGRLRAPHPVPCEGCHHEPMLEPSPEALDLLGERTA